MNKSMLTGVVLGAIAVTAIGGVAGYKALNPKPEFAEVLAAKPVTETVKTPRQECHDVVVNEQAPVKDSNRIAGTAIGAVAGGLLGHQIGGTISSWLGGWGYEHFGTHWVAFGSAGVLLVGAAIISLQLPRRGFTLMTPQPAAAT